MTARDSKHGRNRQVKERKRLMRDLVPTLGERVWVKCSTASLSTAESGDGDCVGCAATPKSGWCFIPKCSAVILTQLGLAHREQMEVIKPGAGWTLQSHWAVCVQAHSIPALTHIKPAEDWVGHQWPAAQGDQRGRNSILGGEQAVFKAYGLRMIHKWTPEVIQGLGLKYQLWSEREQGLETWLRAGFKLQTY